MIPFCSPGFMVVRPRPKAIEQADPGGVAWMNQVSSSTCWSWSMWNPIRS